jgi:hypothetical protein
MNLPGVLFLYELGAAEKDFLLLLLLLLVVVPSSQAGQFVQTFDAHHAVFTAFRVLVLLLASWRLLAGYDAVGQDSGHAWTGTGCCVNGLGQRRRQLLNYKRDERKSLIIKSNLMSKQPLLQACVTFPIICSKEVGLSFVESSFLKALDGSNGAAANATIPVVLAVPFRSSKCLLNTF